MERLREWILRLAGLFNKSRKDRELDEEIESHLQLQVEDNLRLGMTPEAARREAMLKLGGVESIKEAYRDQRGLPWLEALWQDVRYGARMLRKNPGFTTVTVVTLALGIGANTAIFGVVNAVIFRPLPYPQPDRLVSVCERNLRQGWDQYVTSMGAYADWRQQNSVFEELGAATVLGPATVIGQTETEMVNVAAVSANFFKLLGFYPILGRPFSVEEENPGHGNVVLLSERLWRGRFGADPRILNQDIRLQDRTFKVVGIVPARLKLFEPMGVQGLENGFSKADLWRPLPVDSGLRKQRNYRAFLVLGRLKPNVSLARAQEEMTSIANQQAKDYPEASGGWSITVQLWQRTVARNARAPLMLLFVAVALVLLIATANLVNLWLARAVARQKEFAIRMALGASRWRIARQNLAESILLSSLGGVTGLLFAHWGISLVTRNIPAEVPRTEEIGMSAGVLGFTLATSLIVGVLVGLFPLVSFYRSSADEPLRTKTRGFTEGTKGHRLRALLVGTQVALVMVLLVGTGLLIRSFAHLVVVNPGFRTNHLFALDLMMGGSAYTNQFRRIQLVEQALLRVSQMPGVEGLAAVDGLPLDVGRSAMRIVLTSVEGMQGFIPDDKPIAGLQLVSPEYFQIMSIIRFRGRFFTNRDNTNAPPVAIINETFARRYFSGIDPIGKKIESPDFGSQRCEIIGVIKDVRQSSLDAPPSPEVYRPLLQDCLSGVSLVVSSHSGPGQLVAAVRQEMATLDRTVPVYNSRSLDWLISAALAPRRFALLLMGIFAGLALVLALVGIYGVVSCVVNERRREIGIRLSLGAQRSEVAGMVLIRGMTSVAVGGLIGLASACALTRFLRSLLYEVGPIDPLTLISVAALVTIVAFLACWLPAHRAAKVDPMVVLRYE
jgi:putative ABC transport system permease protein